MFIKYIVLYLATVMLISSCANAPKYSPLESAQNTLGEALVEEDKSVEKDKRELQVPEEIEDSLIDTQLGFASQSSPKSIEPRFDVSVNNIPAKTFFLSLVSDSGINVVTDPDIAGEVSLELKNVTVEEVLKVTREVYGYEYRFSDGIYIIYSRKLRTQIFSINYIDVQRVGLTDTNVSIGKITSSSSGDNNNRSNSEDNDSANLLSYLDGSQGGQGGEGSGVSAGARVQTLNKTDFWGRLQQTLLAIIGGEQGGRLVMTNPQAGLVVVKGMPRELSAVRDFLEKSELSVRRQVVLETKILEVRLSKGFEAGINWGAISGQLSLSQTKIGDQGIEQIAFSSAEQTESVVSSVLEIVDITKLLKLLENQGEVQVLSSPRISTVNNQKALIRVGSDEFFVTGITSSTTTSAAAITNQPTIELDSFFSGIALDVTPQIADNGDVILHVHPIITEVSDQQKNVVLGTETISLPLAFRDVRESDSIVRAKNGQVVVLGGLMQERSLTEKGKRPFLGDIPLVNSLFRTKQSASSKTELVILMRPIVIDQDDWRDEISSRQQSLKWFSENPINN